MSQEAITTISNTGKFQARYIGVCVCIIFSRLWYYFFKHIEMEWLSKRSPGTHSFSRHIAGSQGYNYIEITLHVMLSCSVLSLCDPQTVGLQAPLSVEFSRQEYWSELPLPAPEAFPDPGIELVSPVSPALVGGFFTTKPHEITLRCHIKGDNQQGKGEGCPASNLGEGVDCIIYPISYNSSQPVILTFSHCSLVSWRIPQSTVREFSSPARM